MAIFEEVVNEIMRSPGMLTMRPVIEKEILHYDIFQALDQAKLLTNLVFQGDTSLRLCRGSKRFSEDLDFAGGVDFNSAQLARIKDAIESHIGGLYGLVVSVKEPKAGRESHPSGILVDKWQVSVETAPAQRDMPRQKIKIEVANIPAYTRELIPLRLNYPQLQGYSGAVLVQTETMGEVMADKVLAFPACAKPIRHRDIWDIAWLVQQGAVLDPELVNKKVSDYKTENYPTLLKSAIANLDAVVNSRDFDSQMSRFIDSKTLDGTLRIPAFKNYLTSTVGAVFKEMLDSLDPEKTRKKSPFKM